MLAVNGNQPISSHCYAVVVRYEKRDMIWCSVWAACLVTYSAYQLYYAIAFGVISVGRRSSAWKTFAEDPIGFTLTFSIFAATLAIPIILAAIVGYDRACLFWQRRRSRLDAREARSESEARQKKLVEAMREGGLPAPSRGDARKLKQSEPGAR